MAMMRPLNRRMEFIAHIVPIFRKSIIFANDIIISVVSIFYNNG